MIEPRLALIIGICFMVSGAMCGCQNSESGPSVKCPPPKNSTNHAVEDAALRAFYASTNGTHWKHNKDWLNLSIGHCEWHGVICNTRGSITAL